MRIPARGSRIFAAWALPTATSDVAPTELGVFRGRRSYKDVAPTELAGRQCNETFHNFKVDSAMNSFE